jgi:predicted transcriptional regulator
VPVDDAVIPVILHGVKVAISLPDDLHARAERAAERLGRTRSALYAEALSAYLDGLEEIDHVTSRLDDAYGDETRQQRAGADAGRRLIDLGAWEW